MKTIFSVLLSIFTKNQLMWNVICEWIRNQR